MPSGNRLQIDSLFPPSRTDHSLLLMPTSKAVFLDRDGTLIHDGNYIHHPSEVSLLPQTSEALRLLRAAGYQLFLFTNQSGVGRGMFPIESVYACNDRMIELLGLGQNLFRE